MHAICSTHYKSIDRSCILILKYRLELKSYLSSFFICILINSCYTTYITYITIDKVDKMYIQLDFESEIPIYEQLKNEIIIGIAKKQLLPGERLPSVRALASDIGINLHTVNKAYQQLKQEGYLLIHRQRGVVVNPDGAPKVDKLYEKKLTATLRPLIADSVCRGMSKESYLELCKIIYDELEKGDQK